MAQNESNSKGAIEQSHENIVSKKRALINLFFLPLSFLLIGIIGYLLWHVSLRWVAAATVTLKFILIISGIFLLAIEVSLVYLILSINQWALTGQLNLGWKYLQRWLFFPYWSVLPIKQRMSTLKFLIPALIILDLPLGILIWVVTWISGYLLSQEFILELLIVILGGLLVLFGFAYIQLNYLHWVITGSPIRYWRDITNWSTKND